MKHAVPARRAARKGLAGRPASMHDTSSDDDIDWP
jgi:hypothetical protein